MTVTAQALNLELQEIEREQFDYLNNSWIIISTAATKYRIPEPTIREWRIRNGYIRINRDYFPAKVNEGDVAYCVAVYTIRKKHGFIKGAPLLDKDGKPYLLVQPKLSEYRAKKRMSKPTPLVE